MRQGKKAKNTKKKNLHGKDTGITKANLPGAQLRTKKKITQRERSLWSRFSMSRREERGCPKPTVVGRE